MSTKNKCPFCLKSPPEITFSKEHILRDKLNKTFPPIKKEIIWTNKALQKDGNISEQTKTIPQGPFDRTVNSVCKTCNESWMEQLENEVEDELLSLIHGQIAKPTLEAQRGLARWATKTAAVYSLIHRDGQPGFPSSHFSTLKETNEPPNLTYVWYGECGYTHNTFMRYRRSFVGPAQDSSVYLTTIGIGQAVFFIFGSESEVAMSMLEGEVALRDIFSHRVWPIEDIEPMERLVINNDLEMLHYSDLLFPDLQRQMMMQQ